jgi:hypothetical protein
MNSTKEFVNTLEDVILKGGNNGQTHYW